MQAGSLEPYKFQILGFSFVYFQLFWNMFNVKKLLIIVLQKSYFGVIQELFWGNTLVYFCSITSVPPEIIRKLQEVILQKTRKALK